MLGAAYERTAFQSFILPPEQGWQGNTIRKEAKRPENRVTRFPVEKSGEAGEGEASAASQSAECVSNYITHKANPVTLTSYSSPVRAIPQPSARRAVAPLSEAMHSEHDLKERQRRTNHSESFPLWGHNPSTQPAAPAAPLFYKTCGEAATTTLGPKGRQTYEPSGP